MTKKALKKYCLLLILFLLQTNNIWAAQKRVALVIGNGSYQYSPLSNPVNDAQDMGKTLKSLGFEVEVYLNLSRKKMREKIRQFGERLKKTDIGLFYFAGHGVQIAGRNYLVPISADVHSADEVQDEGIDAGSILRKMETAGNLVNIVILDACRNNPFARSFRNLEQGLARMDGPVGSFIAYATAPGSVAADGEGRNGLYTQHLLAALRQPGLTIEQTFKRVRNGVIRDTAGRQIPWESSSLTGEFIFAHGGIQEGKSSTIPPPDLPKGYLQVISNVPNAEVRINQVPRGKLDNSGVLNLSDLLANETEVVVLAPGYSQEKKKIKLIPGEWRQLEITLKPSDVNDRVDTKVDSAFRSKQCLPGKRAVLSVYSEFSALGQESIIRTNAPKFTGLVDAAFKKYNLNFIDLNVVGSRRIYKKPGRQSLSNRRKISEHFNVNYLVKASVHIWESPIKSVSTQMTTIHGDLNISIIDLQTGAILGSGDSGFLQAGLDILSVVNRHAQKVVSGAVDQLMSQVCSK